MKALDASTKEFKGGCEKVEGIFLGMEKIDLFRQFELIKKIWPLCQRSQ